MGKREEKSAGIKVNILNATLDLLRNRDFDKVHVTDICEQSGISKVTFFKYFPQKEDIVFYYFRIFCLRMGLQFSKKERSGVNGLYFLLDEFAQCYVNYPSLMEEFDSNLVNLNFAIKPIPVTDLEREMLFPGVNGIVQVEIQSFSSIVEGFLLEAILNKEITRFSDTKEMKNLVLALLYGLILSAKLLQISEFRIQVRRAVDHLLASWR